jgi:hypothetical protein
MAIEKDVLRALKGLPKEALVEVKDFIGRLKKTKNHRRSPEVAKALAERQHAAIKKWAGTDLGAGFAGRDHDAVLYGGSR